MNNGDNNMERRNIYSSVSVGCFADGTHGDEHVSSKAIRLALDCMYRCDYPVKDILRMEENLRLEDKYEAANEALNVLNNHCTPDVMFEFYEGDLMLLEVGDRNY